MSTSLSPAAITVKYKLLHPSANLYKKHESDLGFDLSVCTMELVTPNGTHFSFTSIDPHFLVDNNITAIKIGHGVAIQTPEGYGAFLFPRSSIVKSPFSLGNSVGVIDPDYRGELKSVYKIDRERLRDEVNAGHYYLDGIKWKVGDRVSQLVFLPVPQVALSMCSELDNTERGDGGFGHTGV